MKRRYVTIDGYTDVPANNETLLLQAVAVQPVSAGDIHWSMFKTFGSCCVNCREWFRIWNGLLDCKEFLGILGDRRAAIIFCNATPGTLKKKKLAVVRGVFLDIALYGHVAYFLLVPLIIRFGIQRRTCTLRTPRLLHGKPQALAVYTNQAKAETTTGGANWAFAATGAIEDEKAVCEATQMCQQIMRHCYYKLLQLSLLMSLFISNVNIKVASRLAGDD
ncbi:hypothetical protein Q3G72_011067 [Acer saccharum]|nr:hypothetical protein Q3G72_011067 [Acer saccharum]